MTEDDFWKGCKELLAKHGFDLTMNAEQEAAMRMRTLWYANRCRAELKCSLDTFMKELRKLPDIGFGMFMMNCNHVYNSEVLRGDFVAKVTKLITDARPEMDGAVIAKQANDMADELMSRGVMLDTYAPILIDLDTPEGKAMQEKLHKEGSEEIKLQ